MLIDSERKLVEKALWENEERYRHLYTKTPAMLHSIDADGRLVDVSDHWVEVLGFERDEVVGRKSTEFLTEESAHYAETVTLPQFMKSGAARNISYQFVKKNGEIIDILLSAIAETDSEGRFLRSLAVLVDVTEQRRIEDELKKARDKLEGRVKARTAELSQLNECLEGEILDHKKAQEGLLRRTKELAESNEDLERFAHVVSHDLQEPLRIVISYLQLLKKRLDGKLDPDTDEFISYAVKGASQMNKFINDLLIYSQLGKWKR